MNKDELRETLKKELTSYSNGIRDLPGIATPESMDTFVRQIVDSIRRVEFVYAIAEQDVSPLRADPTNELFDPLKAAVYFKGQGSLDEAFWLTFLAIHFGKALESGWSLARDVYGHLGNEPHWTWEKASTDVESFVNWLGDSYNALTTGPVKRKFGNHRKYETLNPGSDASTGNVIRSYVTWVGPDRSHQAKLDDLSQANPGNPRALFESLYRSMNGVKRFGRTARFDYLTMLAKLGLADIEPGKTYMSGATGPADGARLLLYGNKNAPGSVEKLEQEMLRIEKSISVGRIGMQVLEDALCNWQKHPTKYKLFRG